MQLRRCRGAPVVDKLDIGAFWWTEVVVVAVMAFPQYWGLTTRVSTVAPAWGGGLFSSIAA